ncbi:hypothetical protein [Halomicrobium katesii]|uniref:hypothetical protein n=1 Tax=Halomicrobium katesii TaxID=437163 RepID=UPI0012BACC5A|nr:hypothetical protein [Halomicrobium katesii]
MKRQTEFVPSRREFMTSAGAAIFGAGLCGISSAQSGERRRHEDVQKKMDRLVAQEEFKKVDELLESHESDYYSSHNYIDRGVSTQREISLDQSSFHIYVRKRGDILYEVDAYANLRGDESNWHYPHKADDACGIVIDSNQWSAKDSDKDTVTAGISHSEVRGRDGEWPKVELEDYDPNNGIAASMKIPSMDYIAKDHTVHLNDEFRDVSDNDVTAAPIKFEYRHNLAYSDSALNVSVGC